MMRIILALASVFALPLSAARLVAVAVAAASLLVSCGSLRQTSGTSQAPGFDPPIRVVTTVLPITLFTRAVAGACATVTPLVPASTGPHDFQARPAALATLRRAQVLVINGLGMEGFLDKLVTAAAPPGLTVIDSSRGVATLAAADHGHGQVHGGMNPHIWLDPLRAVQQVQTIRDGLIRVDPGCAAGYRRRAAAYTAKLQALNRTVAAGLRPYRGKTLVAFHDVAPYFAERYGLKAQYLVDVPEVNPTPADLQRVAAAVKQSQLKALLSEPQQGQRSFNALARDLGVAISVFDPLETASDQDALDPDTYVVVMRRNVADLIQAFGG